MDLKNIRLENLSRPVQHALLAGLVVCLAVVFYIYFMKGLIRERDALKVEIANLETSVAKMTAVESQLKEFEQELARLERYLADLRSMLPAQKETPTILRSVQNMAVSSNLKILKFSPKPVITRDFYSDWPIDIEVQGNYNGLGNFFEKIGRATRIIDVGTISVQNIEGSTDPKLTLKATCTATTFVYRENQPDPAGNDVSGTKETAP
ncbi:MAG: type 4a pilus biogenesis protein PilO [Acidobacteria bacterium]|nr:type 4a pilus biogenesis protein PilO [Acidobacteriota bacterium]